MAMREIGVKEIAGPRHNPRITEYFQTVILDAALKIDESAWCAAFMNFTMLPEHRTKSALARSFMTVGDEIWSSDLVPLTDASNSNPREGDICVFFDNTSSYKGHVGNFILFNQKKTRVLVLGGNQSDSVCYQWFPVVSSRLSLRSIRRV